MDNEFPKQLVINAKKFNQMTIVINYNIYNGHLKQVLDSISYQPKLVEYNKFKNITFLTS